MEFPKRHCLYCGNEMMKSKSDYLGRWLKRKYCSFQCSSRATGTIFTVGHRGLKQENNPTWKGGIVSHHSGYMKKNLGKKKYQAYHRYLMEQHLGRKLTRSEVVHHRNGDKTDNRIENLEVMLLSEHSRLHMKKLI